MNADPALLEILRRLDAEGYDFVTPTPLTHRRVLKRWGSRDALDFRDVFGWSLPFRAERFDSWLIEALEAAGLLRRLGSLFKSAVRVSRVHGRLFLHADFPTDAQDSVFLGPDSYRFADFIARELSGLQAGVIVDIGCGAGVGAITAASLSPGARVIATDVNPTAVRYAEAAAVHAGVLLEVLVSDGLETASSGLQVVLANPPYMTASGQVYRDGGEMHGAALSVTWAREALEKLGPGGRLLLYTASAIVDGGCDRLRATLEGLALDRGATIAYREIDPDVFGEELERPAYADVERIAVITCVLTKPGLSSA